MRIALDNRCAFKGMGGIGRYAWCLLHELIELDAINEYVCYFTHLSPPEPLRLPPNFRVRIFEAGMIDERFDQIVLPTVLAEDRVDLYHNPTFAVPVVRTPACTVATVHDVVFRRHPDLVEPKLRRYLDAATRRACRTADQLITVSHFSKREIVELYGVDPDRVTVIHNGIQPLKAEAPSPEANSFRRLGLLSGPYVLYVGSIEPKKNIAYLIEGFRQFCQQSNGKEWNLALAGSLGHGHETIILRIRSSGLSDRVRVLGYVDEAVLGSLYEHAAAFVYPSLYEGFGFPPIEAMARGIPTIVSNASSLPEVVGDAAVLVDPTKPAELAGALTGLLSDQERRAQFATSGPRQAARFTWRRAAEEHLAVFKSVMSAHENIASGV